MIYEEAKELIKKYLDESETISDFFAKIFPLYVQTMDEDVKLYDPIWDMYIDDFEDYDDDEEGEE